MRIICLLVLLVLTQITKAQNPNEMLQNLRKEALQKRTAAASDTMLVKPANNMVIIQYDTDAKMISKAILSNHENGMEATIKTTFYNTAGNVIGEAINEKGALVQCTKYSYNANGQQVIREGFGREGVYIKVASEYDANGKLTKETLHSPGGTTVTNF